MKHIGILQTGQHSDTVLKRHGDYPTLFRRFFAAYDNLSFPVFRVANGEPAPDTKKCDAWIITGSAAATYEYHSWIPPLEEFVRDAYAEGTPVLGICFGHQLMAQAFGGKVVKSEAGRGLGIQTYKLSEFGQRLLPNRRSLNLIASHQDQVVSLPNNATLLLHSDFCPFAAMSYGTCGLSFQPHPEFSIICADDVAKDWQSRDPIPADAFAEAEKSFKKLPLHSTSLKPLLRDFLLGNANWR